MPVHLAREIPIGADWGWSTTWYSDDEATLTQDLSGYTARMDVRRKPSSDDTIHQLTTENGDIDLGDTDGTITLTIANADTTNFPPGAAIGQLELIDPGGTVTRLISFDFTLTQEGTR